jgi:hypothetical protein
MESRIIYHVEKYISYLFGEENDYDQEQRIYNKLLRLEGEELEGWMNDTLKAYMTGRATYLDFRGNQLENIDGNIKFKKWYLYHISIDSRDVMDVNEIYGENLDEYRELKSRIPKYNYKTPWNELEFIESYFEMYIMGKSTEELKSWIIQLVDPVEMK